MLTKNSPLTPKKVAIIHDWLVGFRGGEQVLEALLELYPNAEIFTLFHKPGAAGPKIESHPIHVSFLNALPGAHRHYQKLLPLFPLAMERFDLSEFDLVISSSHCVAKGIIPAPGSLHICYSHTPMRYAWDRYRDYFGASGIFEPLILPFIHYLRIWDVTSSHRVDHFIANSEWVKKRIAKFYRRDATVIHPFVHCDRFHPISGDRIDYYLVVSALVPYKRIDLAIRACVELGKPLVIVGSGSEEKSLRKLADSRVRFLGRQSHEALLDLYAGAKALLFPGEEDFGITPLEAMACGRPVIAYGRGGATDSVIPEQTGLLFHEQTVAALKNAILNFESGIEFSSKACVERASQFSRDLFLAKLRRTIEAMWQTHQVSGQEISRQKIEILSNPVT